MDTVERLLSILNRLGIHVDKGMHILDFGCGTGKTVYKLLDQGFINVYGYDIYNRVETRALEDYSRFLFGANKLPFGDSTFDLIISEQVMEHVKDPIAAFLELHRIMRPGAHSLHVFPARYRPIEPHIYVPFGGVFAHRWYYKFWAKCGIRNEFQGKLTANEIADENSIYFVKSLNYVPDSFYEVVWRQLGYEYKWVSQEAFDSSDNRVLRLFGKINHYFPLLGWVYRKLHSRPVYLVKPTTANSNKTWDNNE